MVSTAAGFAGDAVRLIRERIPAAAWIAVVVVTVAVVLTGLVPAGTKSTNVSVALVAVGLWLFSFWVSAVVTRFMAAAPGPRWAVDGAFFRFLGSQLLVTIFAGAIFYLSNRLLMTVSRPTSFAASFAAQVIVSLAILPFAPWFAALAIGDRTLGLGRALSVMRGATLSLAGATLLLVLPAQLLHSVLASLAAKAGEPATRAVLGVGDGFVSALATIVLPWALFAAAWRFVHGEVDHAIPDDDLA